ncbi:acyl-CoA thioesterase [Microbacterium sp. zg.Y1090]|uniref:acyl-CoA thioesterase n=1 Tax=Microbacterium TaxID=33882 RepID=UPI00214ABDDB|nr:MULTISPECIES: thioesterase family protein [unclassified Microbacterium]MCR2813164.1 acyl-CoA thioesterase [Microbacterium sp. zg.Y1084]MCR2819477.1 acyl-CoA thioesterase [Microbacterium sp. zg.Y1090]MDL5487331.1 thioesterase family protein [Microbacterium sp. zg-Y1211]WIM28450.1 thioesterase family protein [Microbacterium sp. zg-Y1090]
MTHYGVRRPFMTRWRDNDQYGHLNNVVYYEAMDTAVNAWMIAEAALDPAASPAIALVVSSSCDFRASASFPEPLDVGIGVDRLGTTSITWALAILREGADEPIAVGRFVHVFVDAGTRRPVPVPDAVRAAVEAQLLR